MSERRRRFLFLETQSDQTGEFHELTEIVKQQNETRAVWQQSDTPEKVAEMIREEATELQLAIMRDMPAVEVASEIGDVGYLLLKMCGDLGIDLRDAIEMKILRNDMKYSQTVNSTNDWQEATQRSKEIWKGMGGDTAFYHMYLGLINYEPEEPAPTSPYPRQEAVKSNGNGHAAPTELAGMVQIYPEPSKI